MSGNDDKTAAGVISTITGQQEANSICIQNSGDDDKRGSYSSKGCDTLERYKSQISNLEKIASSYGCNTSYLDYSACPFSLRLIVNFDFFLTFYFSEILKAV